MNEKDIQNLINLAEAQIQAGITATEALNTFVAAGIMDANCNYTIPYQELLADQQ